MAEFFHVRSWEIGRVQVRHYWMMRLRLDALLEQADVAAGQPTTRANGKKRGRARA